MAHPAGETESDAPRLNFDRHLKLEFHGSSVTSDAGLLPFRELDDVLGLMVIAGQNLADGRDQPQNLLEQFLRHCHLRHRPGRRRAPPAEHQRTRFCLAGRRKNASIHPGSGASGESRSRATDGRSASQCQGKWPDQPLDHRSG
jgi:hypothetical protein